MATLATIRNYVKANIGLAQTAAGSEEVLVDEWANDAVVDVLQRTQCHVNCLDLELVADMWKYDLPTEILAIKEIYRDSDGEPCLPVTPEEIIDFRRSSVQSGQDASRIRFAILGHNMLTIWPTPTTAAVLDVWYVPLPTVLSSGTHDLATATYGKIPRGAHQRAVELYVLAKAAEYANDKPSKNGQDYWAQYEMELKRAQAIQNRLPGRLAPARVGSRPQRNEAANDVYPRGY